MYNDVIFIDAAQVDNAGCGMDQPLEFVFTQITNILHVEAFLGLRDISRLFVKGLTGLGKLR